MQMRTSARPRPASNFELYSWFFMRISAVTLFVMAVFHLVYMHIVLGLDAITFDVIAQRWTSPGWRLFDLFLLTFGWIHGTNGIRIIVDDYVHPQGWRVLTKSLLYVLAFILIVLGAYVIFTFKP
jgi:succinate dehydrogenase / fumarate reductase, membrane anchor subunit